MNAKRLIEEREAKPRAAERAIFLLVHLELNMMRYKHKEYIESPLLRLHADQKREKESMSYYTSFNLDSRNPYG